jgi:trehalose/maltose hydrolase-like predicted phosphorylase
MAMVEGFAGVRADGDGLRVAPQLAEGWQDLTINLRYRGVRVRLTISGDDVSAVTDGALRVTVGSEEDGRVVARA